MAWSIRREAITRAKALAFPEIGFTSAVLAKNHIDSLRHQQGDQPIATVVAIRQHDIAGFQGIEQLAKQRVFAPAPLPLKGPLAASNTAPLPGQISPTIRATGKPSPVFWPFRRGKADWFSGLSGIVTGVPSTSLTRLAEAGVDVR